jgi:hypothetical protein
LGILLKNLFVALLGIFPTNCPIGAGEGGSSGRFAPKNGRNPGNAQRNGEEVRRSYGKGQANRHTPHPAQRIHKVFELNMINPVFLSELLFIELY